MTPRAAATSADHAAATGLTTEEPLTAVTAPGPAPAELAGVTPAAPPPEPRRGATTRRILRNPRTRVGLAVLTPIVALAVASPWLPLPGPLETAPADSLAGPGGAHLLGADRLGRDVLSRVIAGARISLVVGLSVAFLSTGIGLVLGTLAGFMGRAVDAVISTVTDVLLTLPSLLVALGMVAVFGAGVRQVIIAVTVAMVPRAIRMQRSLVLGLRSRPFIDAARVASAPTWWLLTRHVVPNTLAPMVVVASIYAANAIIVEASLSFLGLGVNPPTPSWGNMILEGRSYLQTAWWMSTFPGLALVAVALGLHFLADGARQALDLRKAEQ